MGSVGLYVISFNSPKQFRALIESMLNYDKDYMIETKKYLLNNSTDESTFDEYDALCKYFDFQHVKKNNLGISGGRQWVAEHFEKETELEYYLFFEDDMLFYSYKFGSCRNGLVRYLPNLFHKSLEIIKKEDFDFLKLNFSEFYSDNSTQWAWYNVSDSVRKEFWPDNYIVPQDFDPNVPKTKFTEISLHEGIPYAKGEVFYCNWVQLVSRKGNKKMFLDRTWEHPDERVWSSYIYELTRKGQINPGLLLMTPTEHFRFDFYDSNLRKES
jgi:hypothetical protein